MKLWKRNVIAAAIVLFVCGAVYLNWSYSQDTAAGKNLGQAALVGQTDPLQSQEDQDAAAQDGEAAQDGATQEGQEAAEDDKADQAAVDEANAAIQTMADATVTEAQIENLITAKGYADCVAFLGEDSISVVVSAMENGMTDADAARIGEIVKEQTGLNADQIKIIEAE